MKDELKTFQEIIEEALKGIPKGSQVEATIRVLEQVANTEAVKWVNEARGDVGIYFKMFFNIKKEDLK